VRPLAPIAFALALLPAPARAQERVDRRIPIAADASIRIFNLVGFTRIVGWDRDTIAVTGSLPTDAGQLVLGGSGQAAKVAIERQNETFNVPGATLEIRVPRAARVWVKSAAADVEISDVEGEVDVSSVSGRIRVEGRARQVAAESMDGNVEVVGPSRLTRVKTASGTIILRGVLEDITATSVSGPVLVGGTGIVRAHLESVSGEVAFKGSLARSGSLDVQTHGGAIELRLPPATAAEFDLTSFGGTVESEIGRAPATPAGKPVRFTSGGGGGGARVEARTFKGDIRILRQPSP
jgi:DUF4097 and DUF4098 domain-containing protein YvlB